MQSTRQGAGTRGGSPIEFLLETRRQNGWAIVELGGDVDAHTAPRLRERLGELLKTGQHRIVVDAGLVEFMDSTGLGVLVTAFRRATEQQGTLALVCSRPNIIRLLDITGLDAVLPVYESLEGAIASA